MAISDMFKEIDDVLAGRTMRQDGLIYEDDIARQRSLATTEVFYSVPWIESIIRFSIVKYCMDELGIPRSQVLGPGAPLFPMIKRASGQAIQQENKASVWKKYLRQRFNVLNKAEDHDGIGKNDVYVEDMPGGTVKIGFIQSYTQADTGKDFHLYAQSAWFKNVIRKALMTLYRTGGTQFEEMDVEEAQTAGGNTFHRPRNIKIRGNPGRLHGGSGKSNIPTGTGPRSDTTVSLMGALEKFSDPGVQQDIWASAQLQSGASNTQIQQITKEINKEFNLAYHVEGLNYLGGAKGNQNYKLFSESGGGVHANQDTFEVRKEFIVKIVVGAMGQNQLMKFADKGTGVTPNKDKGLINFFKKVEQDLLKKFTNPTMRTSMSMEEMMRKGAFATIAKSMKTASGMPDMRFKVNKKIFADAQHKSRYTGKKSMNLVKANSKIKKKKQEKRPGMPRSTGMRAALSQPGLNPLSLEALLNELLPKVVASKMTSPALNFRSGRFASSVRAENVMVGPRGGVAVDYTYMRDPYETFEPGNAQGSTQRDPRKIIGESVREVAQSMIGDRFLRVRRV